MSDKSPKDLAAFIQLARGFRHAPKEVKSQLERAGVQVLDATCYSPVPTVDEIENSWELDNDGCPFSDETLFNHEKMVAYIQRHFAPYQSEFQAPQELDPSSGRFYWQNPQFSYLDAIWYHCMLRHLKPQTVIEVGAGFSTIIAMEALQRNGGGHLILIEPFGSETLRALLQRQTDDCPAVDIEWVEKPVQKIPVAYFSRLGAGDILFIDSTHTVKMGGDCTYLYLKVVPALASGVSVHVHDVFLPTPLPSWWLVDQSLYWTEQYLLYAYLLDNPKVEVVLAANYLLLNEREFLVNFIEDRPKPDGGSLWFKRI